MEEKIQKQAAVGELVEMGLDSDKEQCNNNNNNKNKLINRLFFLFIFPFVFEREHVLVWQYVSSQHFSSPHISSLLFVFDCQAWLEGQLCHCSAIRHSPAPSAKYS